MTRCGWDSKHTPIDIPNKLSARWVGPFEVVSADGAEVTLDLPKTFGKAHRKVNIRRLKFYEERDSCFGKADGRPDQVICLVSILHVVLFVPYYFCL